MLRSKAVTYIQERLRSGNSSIRYQAQDIIVALRMIGDDFILRSRVIWETYPVAITADATTISFQTLDGTIPIRPSRIIRMYVTQDSNYSAQDVREGVTMGTIDEVLAIRACSSSTGTPRAAAFTNYLNAEIAPTPKATGTIKVIFAPFFTALDPAASDSALNIPDQYIYPVLEATAFYVQLNEPEPVEKEMRLAAYQQWVESCKGDGYGGSVRSISRESLDDNRRRY